MVYTAVSRRFEQLNFARSHLCDRHNKPSLFDCNWLDARVCNQLLTRALEHAATAVYSGDLDFNLFGLGALALWHVDHEHAIFELRVYFVEIGIVRQSEAAHERAVAAFNAVIFLFLLFLFKLPFAGDG